MSLVFAMYQAGDSLIHRASAGIKILFLIALTTILVMYQQLPVQLVGLVLTLLGYILAGIGMYKFWNCLKPIMFFIGCIFIIQIIISNLIEATAITLRFGSLILAATLVTITTPTSEMIDSINFCLTPCSRWLPVEKISLAISLVIRFIPLVAEISNQVLEAQKSRGLEKNIFALALPLILRCLQMSEQIAQALDARGYASDKK